jgi:hypothetical protein
MRTAIQRIAVALAGLALCGCGGGGRATSTSPSTTATAAAHTLQGKLSIDTCNDIGLQSIVDNLSGRGPGDLTVGTTQVKLSNAQGTVVGVDTLRKGTIDTTANNGTLGEPACTMLFTISNVPDSSFYSLTIGTHPASTYSKSQLDNEKWTLALHLSA